MNQGKLVFAQLMQHLPLTTFRRCVTRYRGECTVQSFSCRDQFLRMAFAPLTFRESLRDIEACLRAQRSKLYHLGIRSTVARNTLANANAVRDWRIYADFAQVLITTAREHVNEANKLVREAIKRGFEVSVDIVSESVRDANGKWESSIPIIVIIAKC